MGLPNFSQTIIQTWITQLKYKYKDNWKLRYKKELPWEKTFSMKDLKNYLHGKYVAMDILIYANRFYQDYGENWLSKLEDWFKDCKKNSIHLIIILDGKVPDEKKEVIEQRQKDRKEAKDKMEEIGKYVEKLKEKLDQKKEETNISSDSEVSITTSEDENEEVLEKKMEELKDEMKKLEKKSKHISNKERKELIQLLNNMEIPWLKIPGEAESYCAFLEKNGIVYGTFTQDNDYFLHGGRRMFKKWYDSPNFSEEISNVNMNKDESDSYRIHMWNLNILFQELNINYLWFISWFLFYPTDYHKGWNSSLEKNGMRIVEHFCYMKKVYNNKFLKPNIRDVKEIDYFLELGKEYCFCFLEKQSPTLKEQYWFDFKKNMNDKILPLYNVSFEKINIGKNDYPGFIKIKEEIQKGDSIFSNIINFKD